MSHGFFLGLNTCFQTRSIPRPEYGCDEVPTCCVVQTAVTHSRVRITVAGMAVTLTGYTGPQVALAADIIPLVPPHTALLGATQNNKLINVRQKTLLHQGAFKD